jgi:hypothetical protein
MACEFARLRGPTWRMLESSSSPSASTTAMSRVAGRERSAPRPSSRCQTARFAAFAAQHISFPRRIFRARVVASRFFVSTAFSAACAGASAGSRQILGVSCSSGPENERAGGTPGGVTAVVALVSARHSRLRACPSRATGTSASRRSTVALSAQARSPAPALPPDRARWAARARRLLA